MRGSGAPAASFIELGELGVAVAARVLGEVLLPQQDPRHPGLVELAMHRGPIRRGPPGRRPVGIVARGVWLNAGREQARLQGALAQRLDGGKAVEAGRLGPLAVVAHRRARHPARGANRLVAQAECQAEAQHLLDLSHLRPLPRHPFLPAKPVAEQDGMRRSQRSDTAALNPQLWRIGPKQGWRNRRNRGRIAPKQGGGLDRNHRRFEPKYATLSALQRWGCRSMTCGARLPRPTQPRLSARSREHTRRTPSPLMINSPHRTTSATSSWRTGMA